MLSLRGDVANVFGWREGPSLTEPAVQAIHEATMRVLERRGVHVASEKAFDLLEEAGASVDRGRGEVRIPPELVEKSIESAPRQVLLAGRDPANDVLLGDGRVHFSTFGTGVSVIDLTPLKTGAQRVKMWLVRRSWRTLWRTSTCISSQSRPGISRRTPPKRCTSWRWS